MKLPSTLRARPTFKMRHLRLTFVLPAAALLFALAAHPLRAQDNDDGLLRRGPGPRQHQQPPSNLPPTQPTAPPTPATPTPTPAPAPAPININERPAVRARVIYANHLLEVRADNSSLLQILHDISRETRMSITGGVADQRIFGDYGPAAPATVLATLLDGTGTNMLLQQDPVTGAPVELILSQRAGSPPPSSPNGPGFDDSPFPDDIPSQRASQPAPATAVSQPQPTSPPDPNAPHPTNYVPGSPFNPPDAMPAASAVSAPPAAAAPVAKPSASTPESIYQQLLQIQAAKAKAAQSTSPPAAAAPTPAPATAPVKTPQQQH